MIVAGPASDSHTWNLVYLQLLLEELGFLPLNLGPCVPDELLVAQCEHDDPLLIVLSSVNGHGYRDGCRLVRLLRNSPALAAVPVVIGGKLGTAGPDPVRARALRAAGFAAVFEDGEQPVARFREFLATFPEAARLG